MHCYVNFTLIFFLCVWLLEKILNFTCDQTVVPLDCISPEYSWIFYSWWKTEEVK